MQYLLSVIDDGQAEAAGRSASATADEMTAIDAFNDELVSEGHFVFAQGLSAPSSATVIDNRGEVPILTDGPFVETKEFLAGFWIVQVRDRDEALRLALAGSKACNRRIEARAIL